MPAIKGAEPRRAAPCPQAIAKTRDITISNMPDVVRIAAIRHCFGEPPAMLALRLPQKQQAAIGRLVAAGEIDGEFLASDRW